MFSFQLSQHQFWLWPLATDLWCPLRFTCMCGSVPGPSVLFLTYLQSPFIYFSVPALVLTPSLWLVTLMSWWKVLLPCSVLQECVVILGSLLLHIQFSMSGSMENCVGIGSQLHLNPRIDIVMTTPIILELLWPS